MSSSSSTQVQKQHTTEFDQEFTSLIGNSIQEMSNEHTLYLKNQKHILYDNLEPKFGLSRNEDFSDSEDGLIKTIKRVKVWILGNLGREITSSIECLEVARRLFETETDVWELYVSQAVEGLIQIVLPFLVENAKRVVAAQSGAGDTVPAFATKRMSRLLEGLQDRLREVLTRYTRNGSISHNQTLEAETCKQLFCFGGGLIGEAFDELIASGEMSEEPDVAELETHTLLKVFDHCLGKDTSLAAEVMCEYLEVYYKIASEHFADEVIACFRHHFFDKLQAIFSAEDFSALEGVEVEEMSRLTFAQEGN